MSRSTNNVELPCGKCNKEVLTDAIECSLCLKWYHRRCTNLTKAKLRSVGINDNWLCMYCFNIFPFSEIDDDDFFVINNSIEIKLNLANVYRECLDLSFKPFNISEYSNSDFQRELDPENNFFNSINIDCKYYMDTELSHQIKHQNGFSIIHFNCRSMNANFSKLENCLHSIGHKFDVIAISETWLDKNSSSHTLEGYEFRHQNRSNKNGGGVALYISKCLNFEVVKAATTSIDDTLECLTVEIILKNNKNIIVSCIYRQPGSSIDVCIETINKLFVTLSKRKLVYLCGDFNINLINLEFHKGTRDFIEMLYSLGMYPLIDRPSRIAYGSATLIDNIFTNEMQHDHFSGLLIEDISDHLPVFSIRKCVINRNPEKKFILVRKNDDSAINALYGALQENNWNEIYDMNDANESYNNFLDNFTNMYNEHCPVKKVKLTQNKDFKPWFTKGLQNACKKKNNLYARYLKTKSTKDLSRYKNYKNKLTSILRNCKKTYFDKILKEQKNNMKGTWKILNEIIRKKKSTTMYPETFTHKNKLFTSDLDIANGFNDFFVNVGPDLASKIEAPDNVDIDKYLSKSCANSMFLTATTEEETSKIVNQFDSKISTDSSNIGMIVVKKVFGAICKPFTNICNQSFVTGVFPDKMKTAKVIPLFKSNEKNMFTNYRPVSLLSQFSKILEKLFNNRLDTFLEKNEILVDGQYGFRKARSTSMAITHLIEELTNANEEKKITVGVFIDLKKAFDTIDHTLLLRKLKHYGIRGVANNWLESYLDSRKQFVSLNDCNSDVLNVKCGVPQGSILGPKLFILYINDICNVTKILNFILFADDTNIFCSGKDLKSLCKTVSMELDKLNVWFAVNKLSLNVSKTNFILFGNRKHNEDVNITINNVKIDRVYVTKFLGVLIDSNLNWKEHIDSINNKISKSIAIIYRASKILNTDSLYTLYCTLILPYLSYCIENWGNTHESNLSKILLKQKRVIRIISRAKYYDHTNPLFKKLKILKLKDLIELRSAIFIYRANCHTLPKNLQSILNFNTVNKNYNLRNKQDYQHKYVRTKQKQMCLSIYGIKLWNNLHDDIKQCKHIHSFKTKYKKNLINKY